ncbi:uncharacterized protein LOC127750576 [Frankliniella occidentalis]|uniref:Uncharacterized protein LOC127750576 n=1 Tax=Frankliniella occidentalis TaxID=133901 RepID=A0A9C6X3S4_FRAOC|nr:uncharacterized protein LOC127750576 [Frankliniella occidentalis]
MATTSLVTLEQLPDDMIAKVMQHVAVRDVLACRRVSKRFCSVALHWDIWRHRTLSDDEPCAGAVLRLAPCLKTLIVTGRVPTLAATTTGCAVAKLVLRSWSDQPVAFNAAEYALAVRNQESLGRLRILALVLRYPEKTEADVLYRTVAACSGLESLSVVIEPPLQTTQPIVRGPPSSSLTYFRCDVTENSASFVNTILAGHAATLETVEIPNSKLRRGTTAELIAAMPRLRRLQCDNRLVGLQAVGECKALRELHIHLHRDVGGASDRAAHVLLRVKQLQRVHLESYATNIAEEQSTVLADALKALASSGQSRVDRLALEVLGDIQPLLRSLPSLPALRHLSVDVDPNDRLLKSITPATAPALRLLEIVAESGKCPHAWMHGAAVKAALKMNPLLHIQLWSSPLAAGLENCHPQVCKKCVDAYPQGVNGHGVRKMGLYSHDPGACPSPEDHTDVTDWAWSKQMRHTAYAACTWIHV